MGQPVNHVVRVTCAGDSEKIISGIRSGLSGIGYHADSITIETAPISIAERSQVSDKQAEEGT